MFFIYFDSPLRATPCPWSPPKVFKRASSDPLWWLVVVCDMPSVEWRCIVVSVPRYASLAERLPARHGMRDVHWDSVPLVHRHDISPGQRVSSFTTRNTQILSKLPTDPTVTDELRLRPRIRSTRIRRMRGCTIPCSRNDYNTNNSSFMLLME